MAAQDFDPTKFIDREFETELFENLLQCKDQTRVLAIKDSGGMGKSQLLAKLVYRCRTVKPRTPVSLIALDQLGENNSSIGLVRQMVHDLESMDVNFPHFDTYNDALRSGDYTPFKSIIDLRGATFAGAKDVHLAAFDVQHADSAQFHYHTTGTPTLTPKQQETAEEVCIDWFFKELKDSDQADPAHRPVVVMLDAYERCEKKLQNWIEDEILEHYVFNLDKRPDRFLLVVAGREIPAFDRRWATEDVKAFVSSVNQLGKWTRAHVEKCLKVHGFIYESEQVDDFYGMVRIGMPPSDIVIHMNTYLRRQA